jgi:hypothetical protein
MYSLSIPVSAIRTKIRQQFERHRYVNQLNVVDMLLFQSHAEFQVGFILPSAALVLLSTLYELEAHSMLD